MTHTDARRSDLMAQLDDQTDVLAWISGLNLSDRSILERYAVFLFDSGSVSSFNSYEEPPESSMKTGILYTECPECSNPYPTHGGFILSGGNLYQERCVYCDQASGGTLKSLTLGIPRYKRDDFIKEQNYKCAICATEFSDTSWSTKPAIDHDHKTGRYRGILCNGCNIAIGHMRDNPEALRNAAAYLEKQKTCPSQI